MAIIPRRMISCPTGKAEATAPTVRDALPSILVPTPTGTSRQSSRTSWRTCWLAGSIKLLRPAHHCCSVCHARRSAGSDLRPRSRQSRRRGRSGSHKNPQRRGGRASKTRAYHLIGSFPSAASPYSACEALVVCPKLCTRGAETAGQPSSYTTDFIDGPGTAPRAT